MPNSADAEISLQTVWYDAVVMGFGGPKPEVGEEGLMSALHTLEEGLREAGVSELVRLLESDKFGELTETHIKDVGNYKAIVLGGETFFDKAFSTSKEAASILRLARGGLGRETVLEDLRNLQAEMESQE